MTDAADDGLYYITFLLPVTENIISDFWATVCTGKRPKNYLGSVTRC